MTSQQVKEVLEINDKGLSKAVADGKIDIIQIDGKWRYDEKTVYRYLYETKGIEKKGDITEKDEQDLFQKGVLSSAQAKIDYFIEREYLEMLFNLHQMGVELGPVRRDLLIRNDYINISTTDVEDSSLSEAEKREAEFLRKQQKKIDDAFQRELDKLKSEEDIKSSQWRPHASEERNYPKEFVEFIDSVNSGFMNRVNYDRLDLYVKQAKIWLAKKKELSDCKDDQERLELAREEKRRIRENSLYFLNRFHYYKDSAADDGSGKAKFKSFPAHEILCFLVDSGYPLIIGKGRQIFFSTTMGGVAVAKTNWNKNYFIKFIAENKSKGEEIFDDKIRYAFQSLEPWLKRSTLNSSKLEFAVGAKGGKSDDPGSSSILVEAPYTSAVNGGSPDMVLIDEIGQIKILPEMINEGLPAMYGYDPTLGRQRLKRQIIAWGTGGKTDRGGKAFEVVFRSALDAWRKRRFNGLVPIFFDAYARPGITEDFIMQQKEWYYEQSRIEKTRKYITQFHQHYPISIDDMFLSDADTPVSMEIIDKNIRKCHNVPAKHRPQIGRFEPIFDVNKPLPSDFFIPYVPKGAEFIPMSDTDRDAPVNMIVKPPHIKEPGDYWVDRFYQGTDPIFAQSGNSLFASGIWDAHLSAPVCQVNYREQDYRNCYLQAILMKLYYSSPQQMVKELLEINVGREYANMLEMFGMYPSLIPNKALPLQFQIQSSEPIGVNKRTGKSAKYLTTAMVDMVNVFGDNLYFLEFWSQMKTLTKHTTPSGDEIYKPRNPVHDRDDVLDWHTFAYIGWQAFDFKKPQRLKDRDKKKKSKGLRYVCGPETGWNNILKPA